MADLSDKRRKLIDLAMEHDEPPSTDDSWGAMVSRLTSEGPQGTLPVAEPVRARTSRSWIAIAIAVALALVLVVIWAASDPVVVADRSPAKAATPQLPPPAKAPAVKAAPEPAPDRLLVDAEAALEAGDPDRAMTLLKRHAEIAATDPRAPQRMALRVLALCAKGEQERARDEAKAFLAAHAQSEWAARVRASCGGDRP